MENWFSRFLRTRPLAALSLAIIIGAIAGVCLPGRTLLMLLCALPCATAAVLPCMRKRPLRFAALLCVAALLTAGYGAWRADRPAMQTRRGAVVTGTVADAPEWQSDKLRAVFRLTDVTVDGAEEKYDVRVYAYGELARRITIADEVAMETNLYEPSRSGNGGYDFRKYLWAEGVAQFVSLESHLINVTPQDGGVMERMARLRSHLQSRADGLFPQHAALIRGLTLGDRTEISEADETAFSDSGIMHLLAVSGLHVSILASLLTAVCVALCLPKLAVLILVTLLLIGYAVLCGGSPSIVRAVIMYLLMQGGVVARRGSDDVTRLSFACALMVLYNPLYLWQTGFQLSFAAVAGLMLLTPVMQDAWRRLPGVFQKKPARAAANVLLPGIAVQLGGLPIVLQAFGQLAWSSILLNVFCIPLAQVALILSLIALALDPVLPMGAIAMAADWLTGILLDVAHWAAGLPFGLWHIPALLMPFAVAYGVCALLGSAQLRIRRPLRYAAVCLLPVLVVASQATAWIGRETAGLQITYLDVGQGDAAIINAEGALYLMDTGEDITVAEYIDDHCLDIDGIFLSHAHDDHAGGLEGILEVCDPEWICLPVGYDGGEADENALRVIAQAGESGVEIRILAAGDSMMLSDSVQAQVLYPASEDVPGGGNENSLLLRLEYGAGSALFTGDLPTRHEPEEMEKCTVLKVAHHGSANATGGQFLASVQPRVAVISVGEGNLYGHPKPALLERLDAAGCRVLRTDLHGRIQVDIRSDGSVRCKTYFPEDETE